MIVRNSSFTEQGKAVDIRQVGRQARAARRTERQRSPCGELLRISGEPIDVEIFLPILRTGSTATPLMSSSFRTVLLKAWLL